MDFKDLYQIKNEAERVSKTYDIFDEDTRISTSKAGRVEFLTTARAIMQVVKPGDRILDIGAGTGVYSFYLAEQGCQVDAVELADRNVEVFREKLSHSPYAAGVGQNTALQETEKGTEKEIEKGGSIRLRQGNALDLSAYEEESFDAVLLFGPLYHLSRAEDRQRCIAEAKRVCKKDGTLFFAFISNDMVILTEFGYDADFFKGNSYDHETFKVEDFPFVFFTLDQCRQMLQEGGISIQREIASDGVSELLADRINQVDEESYQQYLRYHFYCCEKPEMLGRSNHLLFVGKKM